jgi:hypothetical protein
MIGGGGGGMILFLCPGLIGPLDAATPARPGIIPFLGLERYDFMISVPKCFSYGQGLTL